MSEALRIRTSQAQQIYTRALSAAYRNGVQLHDPSVWQFRDPEVEEKMLRDADIRHAVTLRRHMIAGKDWAIRPSDDASPRAEIATKVGTELIKGIGNFTDARLNLARAFLSGARFGRIHGVTKTMTLGDGLARTWWVPTRIEDSDKKMYRIGSELDDGELKAHWQRWNLEESTFEPETAWDATHTIRHVYQDDEASLGYGSALRESLGWLWYAKTHIAQEGLAAIERFAQGVLTAKVDGARDAASGLPNAEVIAAWEDVLANMRARHVLVHDKADEISLLPGGGEGWQMLGEVKNELRLGVYTLVLGANLPTSADGGGSFALAEVQENSTEMLVQYDRETLEETLTKSLLGCIWFRNWPNLVELGIAHEKPCFTITQEKRQDPKERAEVASILSSMGVDLSRAELLEQTGFSIPEEGEDIVPGGSATPAMPGGFGGGIFQR